MNTALYKALNEASIEIPFPQRVIHVDHNGSKQAISSQ
jgi:small-conductance mechanosensitive channel